MPSFPLAAGAYRFRALRRVEGGELLRGWDCWALQKALTGLGYPVGTDGVFGQQTQSAVISYQRNQRLEADGIAGPRTQREVALENLWPAQRNYNVPPGLARGIVEGESAFLLGNYTAPYTNATRDVGLTMRNGQPDEAFLTQAFDARNSFWLLCRLLRERKDTALRAIGGDQHERAWRYGAVLAWNWPAASAAYVRGEDQTWRFTSEGESYSLDDPAPWVQRLGVAGVRTGREWVEHYIATKCLYVAEVEWAR